MHDWTLMSLNLDWRTGRATLDFLDKKSELMSILAENVSLFIIPREQEWGRSVSVNSIIGPVHLENAKQKLQIEIQSGDVVEIVAGSFILPVSVNKRSE